jgi:hypothetical protein
LAWKRKSIEPQIIKENSTGAEGAGTHKATIFVLNIKEYIRL